MFVNDLSVSSRVNVTLRWSSDDGKTWPKMQFISIPGGYVDVSVSESAQSAVVLYENSTCQIWAAPVPLASL